MSRIAFTELFREKDRLVCTILPMARNRDVAEDIVAAAFATAFKKRNTFRGESAPATWLTAIAINEAKHWRRKDRLGQAEPIDPVLSDQWAEPDLLVQMLHRKECCLRLRKTLRRIPAIYRRVLVDHFVDGYSIREIAHRDGIPLGTVLSRIFTGKRYLRAAWAI